MHTRIGTAAAARALAATIPLTAGAVAQDEDITLTLLHNNDGESSLDTLGYGVAEDATLEVGGIAAFKVVTERGIADAWTQGNSVVNVYAGDSFLASALLACSDHEDASSDAPVWDGIAQAQLPCDVHVFGNHEFDCGPDFLQRSASPIRHTAAIHGGRPREEGSPSLPTHKYPAPDHRTARFSIAVR